MYSNLQSSNMAFSKNYSKLRESHDFQGGEDVDLEDNASDSTKYSSTIENMDKAELLPYRDDTDESTPSSLARQMRASRLGMSSNFWTWLRWAVIVLLQATLILLIVLKQDDNNTRPKGDLRHISGSDRYVETGSDINGLYKTCMHHRFRFLPQHKTSSFQLTVQKRLTHTLSLSRRKTNIFQTYHQMTIAWRFEKIGIC